MSNYEEWWQTMGEREEYARTTAMVAGNHFAVTGDVSFRHVAEKMLKLADTIREERYTAERVHSDRMWTRWLKVVADITKREDVDRDEEDGR